MEVVTFISSLVDDSDTFMVILRDSNLTTMLSHADGFTVSPVDRSNVVLFRRTLSKDDWELDSLLISLAV